MQFFKQLTDPALKRLYKFVLKRMIGRFLAADELDLDQLDVHLRSGRLELCDLLLNADVLNTELCEAQGLPFRVKKGYLGSVHVAISYANIMSESCLVEIDDIEIVLVPLDESEPFETKSSAKDDKNDITETQETNQHEKKPISPEPVDEISQEGLDFVASWIEQVTSKIKVTLSNICLRLETGQQHNGRDIALQCKLEWGQFTDESASEVQSMYGGSNFDGLYGSQSKMQGSMAASTLFGMSQKGIKFRGMSMDLHLSSMEEDEETRWTERRRTEYSDMVLHPFLASESTIPCYIQVKLCHYEALEAPAMDADVFIHSIRIVLQPQYFSELGKIADAFSMDSTTPKALHLDENFTSTAMYASICDDRPDWMTRNEENEAEKGDGALSLSLREFQRIEQLLVQYRRTQLELQTAHRTRESRLMHTDDKRSLDMRKLSAASVESVGLSDLEDEEDSFFECESGLASSIAPGGVLNSMSQSVYASARYSLDVNEARGARSQVLAPNRRVQSRVKVHLLECQCVLLYDDLPNEDDERHDELEREDDEDNEENSAVESCVGERTKSLPCVDGLERLELCFKDMIFSNLASSQSAVFSFTIGTFTMTEKTLPRMSLDAEEDEAAMLSTCILQCVEISPVSGRKVELATNLSAQMRLEYESEAKDGAPASITSLGVKINVQPVLVELDMYLLDRAHRLLALLEDDPSVSKRKAASMSNKETKTEEYPKMLDVTTDCVEVTLRFPMISSDRIRFGPSSKRGLCEDRLVVTLERVKVSSYDVHAEDKVGRRMPNPFRKVSSLPWLTDFCASFEKASVSLLTPENGNQRSCSLEKAVLFTACSDERSEDVCTLRLRLQTPSREEMEAASESKQTLAQHSNQNPESAGVSHSLDDLSGDDNDGGRVGLNGWDVEALERAESFEQAAAAASLYAVEMNLPCANATLMKTSLDRLLILFDAFLMINPIDVDSYNEKVAGTSRRQRFLPSYMSFHLILTEGTLQISDYVSLSSSRASGHKESVQDPDTSLFTCYFVYESLKLFQVSQYMGQLVSRVHLVAQNMTLLEQEGGRSKTIVPVLYRTPFGVSNAPLLFMGVDITDQTNEMRDMKVEVHVSHVSLRYDVRSKWLVRMLEMMLMTYPVPIIPLDSASMSNEECFTLLKDGNDDVVPLPIAPKTVFTKLFVNFYDVLIDYAPLTLPSRAILVLGKVSISSNVVTGAAMQGYKVSMGDLELFLTHSRTDYDEINAVLLGNDLFLRHESKQWKKSARLKLGTLDGRYPSLLTFLENFGFLQLVTMDFVDVFVRVLDPSAVSKTRDQVEEPAAMSASPELSVELNLGTANIYACFDSFNTLIELVSTWTDQLAIEQKPRDTTAYVGLESGKESPSSALVVTNLSPVLSTTFQPLGTMSELSSAQGFDLSSTSGVRSDRQLRNEDDGDGAVNILEQIDAEAFGSGKNLFPGKTVATDTEARLLRTRMDSIQREKKRMVYGLERDEDVGALESRLRDEYEDRQHVTKPVRINELVIEDYYSKTRAMENEAEETPGAFLMEPEPPATDDPWFSSASPQQREMLYTEETARWLEGTVAGEREETEEELTLFEPVEEQHESSREAGRYSNDETYEDDTVDELTAKHLRMSAFPATSKNWWGMQHGLEEVELSDLQTEETASSFSHHVELEEKHSVYETEDDEDATRATMSMSVINARDGECKEIELDFALDSDLQSRFHRLLDMESSRDGDECESSVGDQSVQEQRREEEQRSGGGHFPTRHASFSSTSSNVGAPSSSPPDQPTARWYYDENYDGTGASLTGLPSRIYPHHVEIPIGGSATSLSFGEKECKEAIRSIGRENAARKVNAPSPIVVQYVLLRNFNLCMRFFGGCDWTRDMSDVMQLHSVEKLERKQEKDVAKTKKEKLVDALLDNYVPSNGGDVFGSEESSGLFSSVPSASTTSSRTRERVRSDSTRKRALKSGRKTEEMLELVVTRIQLRLDLFDDAEAQSLASHTVLALGDIELLDYISTSQIRKIVCYWKSEAAHPRESGSSMVHLQLTTVRPGANLCEEHRLKARFLPLRINLDQEVVKFLRQFVPIDDESTTKAKETMKEEEEEVMRHESGVEMQCIGENATGGVEMEGHLSAWFFQSIDIKPCKIKIDYRPNQINYAALRAGDYLEVINLFVLEGMELVLRRVQMSGLNGWLALCEHVLVCWIQDISRHQIHKCVASVSMPPLRPFVNIGAGAADLILLPIEHYGRDRRLVRGLKKGASSFLKSVTIETLNTASKVAQGTQALLEHADDVVSSSSALRRKQLKYRQAGSRIARNSRRLGGGGIRSAQDAGGGIGGRQYLTQQPATAAEGFGQAYDSLARELHVAAKTIVAVPLVEYKKTGSQGYVRSVIRAVPVAVLRPMIGASEAMAKALIGVRNAVDPELKEDIENKFKDFRAI